MNQATKDKADVSFQAASMTRNDVMRSTPLACAVSALLIAMGSACALAGQVPSPPEADPSVAQTQLHGSTQSIPVTPASTPVAVVPTPPVSIAVTPTTAVSVSTPALAPAADIPRPPDVGAPTTPVVVPNDLSATHAPAELAELIGPSTRVDDLDPSSTVSATLDISAIRDLRAASTILVSGKTFSADVGFPQTGFVGATFQVVIDGRDPQANAQYQWRSSQPWVSVDNTGAVTLTAMPTPQTRTVTLTATLASSEAVPLVTSFTINRWFINAKAEKMASAAATAWCQSQGNGFAVPEASMMTATTSSTPSLREANGKLWNEWGPMALYRSGWQLDNYWGAKTQGTTREMVGLVGGSFYWVPDSSQHLVACVRSLQ